MSQKTIIDLTIEDDGDIDLVEQQQNVKKKRILRDIYDGGSIDNELIPMKKKIKISERYDGINKCIERSMNNKVLIELCKSNHIDPKYIVQFRKGFENYKGNSIREGLLQNKKIYTLQKTHCI